MIGIDIVNIDELKKGVDKYGDLFLRKAFSEKELSFNGYGRNHSNIRKLAACFAGKEAVIKVLGSGNVGLWDIEIIADSLKRPEVMLNGGAGKLADKLGIKEIQLSLSYARKHAIAMAIVTKRRNA